MLRPGCLLLLVLLTLGVYLLQQLVYLLLQVVDILLHVVHLLLQVLLADLHLLLQIVFLLLQVLLIGFHLLLHLLLDFLAFGLHPLLRFLLGLVGNQPASRREPHKQQHAQYPQPHTNLRHLRIVLAFVFWLAGQQRGRKRLSAISLFSSEDIRSGLLPPAFHEGGALIPQSPARVSFGVLLESPALHLHEPSHTMRSIIVYSPGRRSIGQAAPLPGAMWAPICGPVGEEPAPYGVGPEKPSLEQMVSLPEKPVVVRDA